MNVKKIDFPDRDLFILADGDWRGFRSGACAKEPETVEWLRRVAPGSVVWDVGASVGPYSLVAAALGARMVYAFEPYGPSYGHLCSNISLNKMDKQISAFPVALGPESYGEPIYLDSMGVWPSQPGIGSHISTDGAVAQAAMWTSANWFMHADGYAIPDHVKVDVDGQEGSVIGGGRDVWPEVQSVMVESTEKGIEDIAVILSGCGLEQTGKWERSGGMFNYLFERPV